VASFPYFNGTTLQCGPGLHYSVDLRIQTYTEPVPLKHGKLAAKKIRGYADIFYGVRRMPYPEAIAPHARARGVNVAQRILNLKTY